MHGMGFKKGNDANTAANRLRGLEACEENLASTKALLGETISERDELRLGVGAERRKASNATKKLQRVQNANEELRELLRVSNAFLVMMRGVQVPADDAIAPASALSGGLEPPCPPQRSGS